MGVPHELKHELHFFPKKKTGKERVVAMQAHVTRASGQGFARHCIHQLLQFVTQQWQISESFCRRSPPPYFIAFFRYGCGRGYGFAYALQLRVFALSTAQKFESELCVAAGARARSSL